MLENQSELTVRSEAKSAKREAKLRVKISKILILTAILVEIQVNNSFVSLPAGVEMVEDRYPFRCFSDNNRLPAAQEIAC